MFSLVTDVKNEIAELRKEQQTSRERMVSLHEQIARLSEYIDPNQVRSPSLSHSTTNSDGNGERSRQDNNRLYGTTGWSPYYVGDAIKPMVYNGPMGLYMYNPSYSYVSSNVNTSDARHVEQPYFHSHLNSNATNSPPYIPQATRRPPSTYFTQSLPRTETSPSRSSPKSDKSSPSRTESQQEEPHNGPASPVEQNLEHTLNEEEENYTNSRRITRSSTKPNQQRITTRRSSLGNTAKKRVPPKLPSPVLPPKRRARTVKSYRIVSDSETEGTDESEQDPTEEINVGNKKQNNKEKDDGKTKTMVKRQSHHKIRLFRINVLRKRKKITKEMLMIRKRKIQNKAPIVWIKIRKVHQYKKKNKKTCLNQTNSRKIHKTQLLRRCQALKGVAIGLPLISLCSRL